MTNLPSMTPSEFVALTNQTLEYAYPTVVLEAEVAQFKINQGKFVFFDAKDQEASVPCFLMAFQLPFPLRDGMTIRIVGTPKLTQKGRFSLTVRSITPLGEGTIKKSFELLKKKLSEAGLFDSARKRSIAAFPARVGIITSRDSAGYADFIKIANERLGGVQFLLYHVQVQGDVAAEQVATAIGYFNAQPDMVDALVVLRGGGSAEDLAAFNDERLVRAVAQSRIPIMSAIGHETDESLVDLAADVQASTPSNAAQLLLMDKQGIHARVNGLEAVTRSRMRNALDTLETQIGYMMERAQRDIQHRLGEYEARLERSQSQLLLSNPERVLKMGYAVIRGAIVQDATIEIETATAVATAKVTHYEQK